MLNGPNAITVEQLRERPLHHAPVGEHVTDAGGNPQVILEHDELAGVQAQ